LEAYLGTIGWRLRWRWGAIDKDFNEKILQKSSGMTKRGGSAMALLGKTFRGFDRVRFADLGLIGNSQT